MNVLLRLCVFLRLSILPWPCILVRLCILRLCVLRFCILGFCILGLSRRIHLSVVLCNIDFYIIWLNRNIGLGRVCLARNIGSGHIRLHSDITRLGNAAVRFLVEVLRNPTTAEHKHQSTHPCF